MQEWRLVIKDLNFVLVFKPVYVPALLMRYSVLCLFIFICHCDHSLSVPPLPVHRARTYSCIREWGKAAADYNEILKWYPWDAAAQKGLQDMAEVSDELPMIDPQLLSNE